MSSSNFKDYLDEEAKTTLSPTKERGLNFLPVAIRVKTTRNRALNEHVFCASELLLIELESHDRRALKPSSAIIEEMGKRFLTLANEVNHVQ